jgi:putative tryptophan/tyrosine transport system substrate-binding protein
MIDRRTFICTLAGSLVATTIAAEAQVVKTAQIGFLSSGISSFAAPHGRTAFSVRALRDSLAELGYIENQNFTIEYRFAEEKEQRLPSLAAELVKHGVDVIVTPGPSATSAAKNATGTIPIVAIDFESDPVAAGFAASFARRASAANGWSCSKRRFQGWFGWRSSGTLRLPSISWTRSSWPPRPSP